MKRIALIPGDGIGAEVTRQVEQLPGRLREDGSPIATATFDVTRTDKANAIPHAGSRHVFEQVGRDYDDLAREAVYRDALALDLVHRPSHRDVIVTPDSPAVCSVTRPRLSPARHHAVRRSAPGPARSIMIRSGRPDRGYTLDGRPAPARAVSNLRQTTGPTRSRSRGYDHDRTETES